MRKLLLTTVITSVALVGCVEDESLNPKNKDLKVTFDNPVLFCNEDSRAAVKGELEEGAYPTDESFVVYAISYADAFNGWNNGTLAAFNGTTVSYDGVDGWTPKDANNNPYFWESEYMAFAACSPADLEQDNWDSEKRTYGATGLTIPDFEVAANPADQYDLLFSQRKHYQKADISGVDASYNGVPIVFQHALSSIRFALENSSNESVKLVSIAINDVNYKGTFNENITENGVVYDRESNVDPEWTVVTDATADYTAIAVAEANAIEFPTTAALVEDANTLLLMPQALSDNAQLEIKYLVNGAAKTKYVKLNTLKSINDALVTTIDKWEMGKRYNYVLRYNAKDKIYFVPTVEGWVDVNNIVVNL